MNEKNDENERIHEDIHQRSFLSLVVLHSLPHGEEVEQDTYVSTNPHNQLPTYLESSTSELFLNPDG